MLEDLVIGDLSPWLSQKSSHTVRISHSTDAFGWTFSVSFKKALTLNTILHTAKVSTCISFLTVKKMQFSYIFKYYCNVHLPCYCHVTFMFIHLWCTNNITKIMNWKKYIVNASNKCLNYKWYIYIYIFYSIYIYIYKLLKKPSNSQLSCTYFPQMGKKNGNLQDLLKNLGGSC